MSAPCDAAPPSASPYSFAGPPHPALPPRSSTSRATPPSTPPLRVRALFAQPAESVSDPGSGQGAGAAPGTGSVAHGQPPPHDPPGQSSTPLLALASGGAPATRDQTTSGSATEAEAVAAVVTQPHAANVASAATAPDVHTPPREAHRRAAPSRSPSPPPMRQCDHQVAVAGPAQAAAGAGDGTEAAGAAAGGARPKRWCRGGKLVRARKRARALAAASAGTDML